MHKRKPLALFLAQAIGAGSFLAASPHVIAQERERFTVTGSSISRTVTEGALPVLTLGRPYIEQSGATNATELIRVFPKCRISWPIPLPSTAAVAKSRRRPCMRCRPNTRWC